MCFRSSKYDLYSAQENEGQALWTPSSSQWLEIGVFRAGGEAGTVLGDVGKFAVAEDAGIGIILRKILQQLIKGVLLGCSTRVVSMTVLVQAAFVDNAEGTVVVVTGVNALDILWQKRNDIAVETDVVVVAALAVLGFAAGNQVFNAEGAVAFGGGAVDDQH